MMGHEIESIIYRYMRDRGWTDVTMIDLMGQYIENQKDAKAFEDFLEHIAQEEEEMYNGSWGTPPSWEG